jgi:hypothetical protein
MADRGISLAFGAVVRKHRKANGLSQEALAERADIHHTHVGLIERGERMWPTESPAVSGYPSPRLSRRPRSIGGSPGHELSGRGVSSEITSIGGPE